MTETHKPRTEDMIPMLEIRNLHVTVEGREILKGIDLSIRPGRELTPSWARMARARARWPMSLLGARAIRHTGWGAVRWQKSAGYAGGNPRLRGIIPGLQYPVEIPGVANLYFLKAAVNAVRKYRGEPAVDAMDFWGTGAGAHGSGEDG